MEEQEKVSKGGAVLDHILNALAIFTGVIMVFIWIVVCVSVFTRYIMNEPLLWTVLVTEFSLTYITFLGAAWVLRKEGHVSLDLVVNMVNAKTQSAINAITSIIGTILCLVIAWYSGVAAWDTYRRGVMALSAMPVPLAPMLVVMPLGFFLLFIQFTRRSFKYMRMWMTTSKKEGKRLDTATEF